MVLRIAIAGSNGRMGQAIRECAAQDGRFSLATEGNRDTSPEVLMSDADAVIDFTQPEYSLDVAKAAAEQKKIHIIGTTGFMDAQMQQLKTYAKQATMVWSANMSMGVNLLASLVEQAAQALDNQYDIEVSEMHHRYKKDSPSGTALMLAEAAAKGRGVALTNVQRMYAKGMIGAREEGAIGLSVRRGGDVVGEHEVLFAGIGEVIGLSHRGFDRSIYARGALAAAAWAEGKRAGFYSMRDVLGLA
jgi:4-hydroxy-tetrahydrodipicolinate reductase